METTTEAPARTWTVWLHARYHTGATEVWTGTEYSEALGTALDVVLAAESVSPLNPDWTVAAHVANEDTTNSWKITTGGDSAIVFITFANPATVGHHPARR